MNGYYPWGVPAAPPPAKTAADILYSMSPAAGAAKVAGIGTIDQRDTASAALGLLYLGIAGTLSYFAAAAMTPSGSKARTWGLIGIPVGLFTGPIGLGIMGIVAVRR